MERGEFAQAARLFDRLAVWARQRGLSIRAAHLGPRGSQAYLAQDDVETALDRIRRSIRVLVDHGRAERVAQIAARVEDEPRARGYAAHATDATRFAEDVLAETGLSLDDLKESRAAQRAEAQDSLPARCEGCEAPLLPGDVTWHDAETAECPYCGVAVKAT
jgi:hypothetical protein